MRPTSLPRYRAARGFSLAELLIAVAIGLTILAGLSSLFVKNTRAQGELEKANRQVENGRYAIDVLAVDLRNAGYYGEFDASTLTTPAVLPPICASTLDDLTAGLALPVQGADSGNGLACLSDVRDNTDVLVVRRTRTCVAGETGCDDPAGAGPFFQASLCDNPFELDSVNPANHFAIGFASAGLNRHKRDCTQSEGSGTRAVVRRYLTHIYFIANNNDDGDGIPTLKRAELRSTGAVISHDIVAVAEGIENLQLEYGLDLLPVNRGDGVAELYAADPAAAAGCAAAGCAAANWRGVVSVKLNLLARNTLPSPGFSDTKSYVLGQGKDGKPHVVPAANDFFKRHVFQSLVNLPNPTGRRLP